MSTKLTRDRPAMASDAERETTTMTDHDVISDLRKRYDDLTQSQKRIAEAIVEDPEFLAFATVDKMAARLGVSPSTVVRFAYRLGLNGYQELQERVRQLVRSQMRTNADTGSADNSVTSHLGQTIFAQSLEHDLEILRRTIINLNVEDLERAVSALLGARRVFTISDGASFSAAAYAARALERMLGDAVLLRGEEDSAAPLQSLSPDDVVLAISFPPYATSTVKVVAFAKEVGATVIAITDTPISPVGQRVDIVLSTLSSGIGPQNSLVGAVAFMNALLNGIARVPEVGDRYARMVALMNRWDLYVLKGDDGS
jgi:DNA-binding MurR/RpiR family transcriptional regulator